MNHQHYREPIKHTCPDIDKAIKAIADVNKLCRLTGREDEADLKSIINDIEYEVRHLDDLLEGLRESNDELRRWGIEEADRVDELMIKMEDAATTQ